MNEKEQLEDPQKVKLKKFAIYDKRTMVMHIFDEEEKKIFKSLNRTLIFLTLTLLLIVVLVVLGGVLFVMFFPIIDSYIKTLILYAASNVGG